NLRPWIPVSPKMQKAYYWYLPFGLMEDLLIKLSNRQHEYFAALAMIWMNGTSLREMVADKVERAKTGGDLDKINDAIRELFETLEDVLRFRYVKYFRLYSDVLRVILLERGFKDEAEKLLPIHLFLEYGAATQTLINLMALGLSRTSALLLRARLGLKDDLSAAECQQRIETLNLDRIQLPALCRSEIRRLRRTRG